ncbi:ER membrane glycoprotein subunit of the GPI transamidase complex-like protein [Aspergillus fumigatus]|nr:ER membrane glycoprotein subunit of the GPI transamidase complex-like protein [Aspergillus fumigatus]KAH1583692.1 ER membrane glycoprotein subunit of the GPI transamidase complex-like protein [Aspergillus fumigatus]KAH1624868.1 ER membrane glycoprotein subunit of the GPI transamidase complex-like protein [Aspergillus fumigatus]KAH1668054.1 ER membrane glycoprotein subunit of the GPI transamidase complex-like protein [Aspergillus fumigatus]KAH1808201.1 ER membrane glycoprotein subunit of the 
MSRMTVLSLSAGSQSACSLGLILVNPRRPLRSLSILFGLWKALIFLVIVICPGLGYDTSTSLLLYPTRDLSDVDPLHFPLSLRFVRWDSIYFVHAAEHGYVFEQEWAFGYGYTRLLALLASVLVLYRLSVNIFGGDTAKQKTLCFLSAALHIISPAGAFLSAPYGEALFSLLNISGLYLYSSSVLDAATNHRLSRDLKLLAAAVLISAATAVRSNGILGGVLFAYDALLQLPQILSRGLSLAVVSRLAVIVLGGCVIALGMAVPQYIAFNAFCMTSNAPRPWCGWTIPSIYRFVQEKYWNVGFLRYWVVPNIPLFLLAMPILALLLRSAFWAWRLPSVTSKFSENGANGALTKAMWLLPRLAIIQALLAVLAFTSYHVQIINRLSSGYPLWYWYLAAELISDFKNSQSTNKCISISAVAVQAIMIYGLIHAVLFGSFLPPA